MLPVSGSFAAVTRSTVRVRVRARQWEARAPRVIELEVHGEVHCGVADSAVFTRHFVEARLVNVFVARLAPAIGRLALVLLVTSRARRLLGSACAPSSGKRVRRL